MTSVTLLATVREEGCVVVRGEQEQPARSGAQRTAGAGASAGAAAGPVTGVTARAEWASQTELLDDATLVVRAQEGDARAFETLVRRHQRPLHALAVRLTGNREEAADAVQDAFIAAWRRLPEFRGEALFSTWMYRIATNRCLSAARARRPTVPLDALAEPLAAPPADGPADAAEARDRSAALGRAVAALPPEQRACWVLREIDGLSYAEIAEIVRTSPDAVRGRIHRARVRLAEVMRPWR